MKISIIGGGAMGGALARGLALNKHIPPFKISVSNPHLVKIQDLEDHGIKISTDNKDIIDGADVIVIAVKPWKVKEVIEEIKSVTPQTSAEWALIVAGIPSEELLKMFADKVPSNISIVMPNTAMTVNKSMTFIVPLNGNFHKTEEIFKLVGKVMVIDEKQLPAAMALASCGIAFAMRYIRALCEGGVELGFKASLAQEIVCETLKGAVALLEQPDTHPESEIDKVTTPGGITIRGLNTMEKNGFSSSVIEGLKACR